jgi:D-3-phosphoglycerate dehydrogenase
LTGGFDLRPNIVVLERIHDHGLDLLAAFADVRLALGLGRPQQLAAVSDADAVVIRSVTRIDAEFLEAAPKLKAIGRAGTGKDNIDLERAASKGVRILTTPGANADSTADFTVAQILNLSRNLYLAHRLIAGGDFRRHQLTGRELSCMTVGIVGLGNVGQRVAKRLAGFGCDLIGYDPNQANGADFPGLRRVKDADSLFAEADVVTLHSDLNGTSHHLVDARRLSLAKPGLLLVNASRAEVVDDEALLAALNSGQVAAAALDVLSPEPDFDSPPQATDYQHRLLDHPNVFVTPHMAASTSDCQRRIGVDLASQLRDFFV